MEERISAPGVESEIRDLRFELAELTGRMRSVVEYLGMIAASLEGIKDALDAHGRTVAG